MLTKTRLRQLQEEIVQRRQYKLDFERRIREERKRKNPELRPSGESPAHVKRLLELAAKVPNVVEKQSPMQSSLHPSRFSQQF